jgi:peptidoglycan/LPS O-acetylase OafA/YrhL
MTQKYRPEIDGLRALAIVPVILFHVGIPGFTGGYIGVDVFFVISGFLITGILLDALDNNRFSLWHFYDRRIRRILPVLFTVLAVTTIASWKLLFPDEFTNFGKSLFSTALFYANYHFMHDTGYFALSADSKPLLHMWSLAVEEQYYVLFPVFIYIIYRYCRHYIIPVTLFLCVLSLIYSILLTSHTIDHAFYSAPARAWELMTGSFLAVLTSRSSGNIVSKSHFKNGLALLGLFLIVAPIFLYSESTIFPGVGAIPPVLGAALILYATRTAQNPVTWVLSLPVVRFIGLISYSLYLWHWPILVLYKLRAVEYIGMAEKFSLIAAIYVIATLSWYFVESYFRKGAKKAPPRRVVSIGVGVLLVCACGGAVLALSTGLPGRFSPEVHRILAVRKDVPSSVDCQPLAPDDEKGLQLCALGDTAKPPHFAVWGDSHGEALLPAISAAATKAGASGIAFVRGGCPSLVGARQARADYADCDKSAERFMIWLAENPQLKQVILASRWALYASGKRFKNEPGPAVFITDNENPAPSFANNLQVFERELSRTLERLVQAGRKVVVITQVPEIEYNVPLAMARFEIHPRPLELAPLRDEYLIRQETVEKFFAVYASNTEIYFAHPWQLLCLEARCKILQDALPIYRDSNHLTRAGALALQDVFIPIFSVQDK